MLRRRQVGVPSPPERIFENGLLSRIRTDRGGFRPGKPQVPSPPERIFEKARDARDGDSILRCVNSKDVQANFGFLLRSGPTGSEKTYDLSKPIDDKQHKLDVFVSHSWRDNGFLKYLALCYHFNADLAFVVALVVGVSVFMFQRLSGVLLLQGIPFFNLAMVGVDSAHALGLSFVKLDPSSRWAEPDFQPPLTCTHNVCGALAFTITFLFGHNARRGTGLFLDKVCWKEPLSTRPTAHPSLRSRSASIRRISSRRKLGSWRSTRLANLPLIFVTVTACQL